MTAGVLIVLAFVHSTTRLWAALAVVGFALLGAVVLVLCARGLLALRPSSRSPVVLLQLIALPVGYSLGIQAGRLLVGVPILAVGGGGAGAAVHPAGPPGAGPGALSVGGRSAG